MYIKMPKCNSNMEGKTAYYCIVLCHDGEVMVFCCVAFSENCIVVKQSQSCMMIDNCNVVK